MPQPVDRTVPPRRPQFAAGAGPHTPGFAASTGQSETPRHRRPESLADSTRLRPVSAAPSPHRRSADALFDPGEYEDSFIERGFPEPTRAERRRAEAIRLAEQRRTDELRRAEAGPAGPRLRRRRAEPVASPASVTQPVPGTQPPVTRPAPIMQPPVTQPPVTQPPVTQPTRREPAGLREPSALRGRTARRAEIPVQRRRRAETPLRAQTPADPRRRGERGRHAAPADAGVTIPSLTAVRDGMADGLPTARRAAASIVDWAVYTGGKPPVTGTHRAPGTLPIESWLLIGKSRQQALLATLAAVGLLLIALPVRQGGTGLDPVNAAERAAAAVTGRSSQSRAPRNPAEHTAPAAGQSAKPPTRNGTPSAAPPTAPASSAPAIEVPRGAGPANSLRTTGSNTVALTFDDGPDPVETPRILAILAKNDVRATFCLVGRQVERHPEIVRQIVAAGHTLCNHTWSHSLMIGKQQPAQMQADLQRTNDAIQAAAPGAKIPFFRAPGGNFTDRLVETAYGDGMTSLYWQIDPRDWDHPAGEDAATHTRKLIANVQRLVRPGSIVLSHDFNQPDTIKAYEELVPWLKERFALGVPREVAPPVTRTEPPAPPSPSAPSEPPPASPSGPPAASASVESAPSAEPGR